MSVLYSKIKPDIKSGDLLAWRVTRIGNIFDFILFLYQKIFGVTYSHVGIAVRLGKRVFLVEATPPSVRIYPLSMCDDFYLIKARNLKFSLSDLNLLFKHLGKRYSLTDLVKGFLNMKNNNSSLYCSELAKEFYKDIGYLENADDCITPDDIVKAVQNKSGSEAIFVVIDSGNI